MSKNGANRPGTPSAASRWRRLPSTPVEHVDQRGPPPWGEARAEQRERQAGRTGLDTTTSASTIAVAGELRR